MQEAGVEIAVDITKLAVVGFIEVLRHLGTFLRTLRGVLRDIERIRPQAVVLIDYPGFNLRLAAHLKQRRIPVIYYISPQVWAWKKGRVKKIARRVDKMICLFDFEVPLYEKEGLAVRWVGHPFLDVVRPEWPVEAARKRFGLKEGVRTIGILPGSRVQEIKRHLPVLVASAQELATQMGSITLCRAYSSTAEGRTGVGAARLAERAVLTSRVA